MYQPVSAINSCFFIVQWYSVYSRPHDALKFMKTEKYNSKHEQIHLNINDLITKKGTLQKMYFSFFTTFASRVMYCLKMGT